MSIQQAYTSAYPHVNLSTALGRVHTEIQQKQMIMIESGYMAACYLTTALTRRRPDVEGLGIRD